MRILLSSLATVLLIATAGAQEVRPERVRTGGAPGPRVVLREVLRIGSADGEHDGFGRIMDVTLDRRGRIYVADEFNHRVSVFEADGRFRGVVGRRGRGPGEMEAPWKIAVDANDSLFVYDINLARVTVFGPDLRYARDFAVPAEWLVNSLEFLSDGRLLFAAYGTGERGTLHVLSRTGQRLRTFGPRPPAIYLAGFESSLLGGSAAVTPNLIAYSNKSPYEITFYSGDGRLLRRCTGDPRWTTRPGETVREDAHTASINFGRYVHSSEILALGGGLFLNVIHDPVAGREILDLIGPDCRLRRRTVLNFPLLIADRAGSRIVASQELEFPEIVVYSFTLQGERAQPRSPGRR